jgi:hypothetical protein
MFCTIKAGAGARLAAGFASGICGLKNPKDMELLYTQFFTRPLNTNAAKNSTINMVNTDEKDIFGRFINIALIGYFNIIKIMGLG